MSTMGNRIHVMRKKKDWTMEYLASRLGVQKSAVNKWEKGAVDNIRRDTIEKMADLFGVSPVWLMGFDVPMLDVDLSSSRAQIEDARQNFTLEKGKAALTAAQDEFMRKYINSDTMEVITTYSALPLNEKNMIRRSLGLLDLEDREKENSAS